MDFYDEVYLQEWVGTSQTKSSDLHSDNLNIKFGTGSNKTTYTNNLA